RLARGGDLRAEGGPGDGDAGPLLRPEQLGAPDPVLERHRPDLVPHPQPRRELEAEERDPREARQAAVDPGDRRLGPRVVLPGDVRVRVLVPAGAPRVAVALEPPDGEGLGDALPALEGRGAPLLLPVEDDELEGGDLPPVPVLL